MSDSDKQPPADDPWAKWRQPEAAAPAAAPSVRETEAVRKPKPRPAPRAEAPVVPAEPVKPEVPVVRERPTGTLSPIKTVKPARPVGKKTQKFESTAASAPRPHKQMRGGKARDARPVASERPVPQAVVRDPSDAPQGVRLSKVMSERGLCSRREADLWIERGWVFVNGEPVSELGTRIDPASSEITVTQEAKKDQAKAVTILLHKPVGYVSGQPEPDCVPAVTLVTAENQMPHSGGPEFKPWMLRGLAPAGRLDVDSTGLLVLTSDGRVAKRLIGEDSDTEKEYLVRVSGEMIKGGLDLLRHGLALDGKPLKPAWVKQLNEDQLHFILKEGKKRQIRRMCELVGLHVIGLKRVRIGRIRLGDLPMGQWRFLREGEAF